MAKVVNKGMSEERKKDMNKFDNFGEVMPDGRLTVASEGKVYRLREAIRLSEQLGRPLTNEEMKQFEV